MERFKKNGYTFRDEGGIFFNSKKAESCIKYIIKNKITCVYVNHQFDFDLNNLDFLKRIDFIEKISIETAVEDFSGLNTLVNLKFLSISYMVIKQELDFLNFPKLEYCNLTYTDKVINLNKCTSLKRVHLWNLKKDNAEVLKGLVNLEEVSFYASKIKNLNGLEDCQKLKKIEIVDCRNLETIDSLLSSKVELQDIRLRNCRNFKTHNILPQFVNLKYFVLSNCGSVASTAFLTNLSKLRYGYLDIDILDGDVSALMNLPVIFKNYKHFNFKNNLKIKDVTNDGNYLVRDKEVVYKISG